MQNKPDNHFDWYMASTLTCSLPPCLPINIISQVRIHLLYFVKPCQNRPESPADKQRPLNTNCTSCQSSGCTAPSNTAGRQCVPKHRIQYITLFWKAARGISWAIWLRGWDIQQWASSSSEGSPMSDKSGYFLSIVCASEEQSTAGGRLGGNGTSWASGLRDILTVNAASCREEKRCKGDTSPPAELPVWIDTSLRQL